MDDTTIITCGPPKDHQCDSDGPQICGGEDENGNFWTAPLSEKNGRRAEWGSVTCSKCGMSAMDRSLWEGP